MSQKKLYIELPDLHGTTIRIVYIRHPDSESEVFTILSFSYEVFAPGGVFLGSYQSMIHASQAIERWYAAEEKRLASLKGEEMIDNEYTYEPDM